MRARWRKRILCLRPHQQRRVARRSATRPAACPTGEKSPSYTDRCLPFPPRGTLAPTAQPSPQSRRRPGRIVWRGGRGSRAVVGIMLAERGASQHAQDHVACPEVGLRVWAECATSREAPGVGIPAGLGPAAPPAALAAKPRSADRAGGRGRSGGLPGVRRPRGSESAGPARSLGSLTPDATRLGAPPSESPVPPWVSARPGLAVSDSRPALSL